MINNNIYNILNYFTTIQFGGKRKWSTLFHNGLVFPLPYKSHNIPLKYKDQLIRLNPEAEEYAMIYVKYLDTDYIKNKMFNKNFWNDWKKLLDKDTPIKSLEDCDFTEFHQEYLESKKCKTDEEKQKEKKEKEKLDEKYKIAILDGKEQELSSYYVEPPGIFLGRGSNPLIGKIKHRLYPEDFTINIGKDVASPETLSGHKWGEIVHNRNVEWIASWSDNVTGKTKYVWLSSSSDFKANNDYKKFELARKLKKKINRITEANTTNLQSDDMKIKQLATALYFIDKLAIRVGNEKGEDETDTVGCTTLRLEHIHLEKNRLTLDFLGKDSVRYYNSIIVDDAVKDNVKLFMEGKNQDDQLFDLVSSTDINSYLQTFMKNVSAKTFRTFRASAMFQKELFKINKKFCDQDSTIEQLLEQYNLANLKVAKYLNHQKNITKGHKQQVENITNSIKKTKSQLKKEQNKKKKNHEKINKIKEKIKKLKGKKALKEETKNLSLTTSRQNYIDCRITIAFMKKHNIPTEKLFTKVLQKKFKWAFDVDEDFKF
jgi:DNA topoisomerase I